MKKIPSFFFIVIFSLGLLVLIPTPSRAQSECQDAGCSCMSDRIIGDQCTGDIRYDLECPYSPGSPERSCCCPADLPPPPTCTGSCDCSTPVGQNCPSGMIPDVSKTCSDVYHYCCCSSGDGGGGIDECRDVGCSCMSDRIIGDQCTGEIRYDLECAYSPGSPERSCCCPTGGGNGDGNGGTNGAPGGWGTIDLLPPLTATSFEEVISGIIRFVFQISLVVAPLMIIVGGSLFVTAGGNLERIAQAKKIMVWTVVGFLIVLLARGIVDLIGEILGTP